MRLFEPKIDFAHAATSSIRVVIFQIPIGSRIPRKEKPRIGGSRLEPIGAQEGSPPCKTFQARPSPARSAAKCAAYNHRHCSDRLRR
jgi:hypothetical protein